MTVRRVLIRVDATEKIGFGHIRRCIALAKQLVAYGFQPYFIGLIDGVDIEKELTGARVKSIKQPRYDLHEATKVVDFYREIDARFLIVDHYCAGEDYQDQFVMNRIPWLQFDGAAQSVQLANIVVSMGAQRSFRDYRRLIRRSCTRVLAGSAYAILRGEFLKYRNPRRSFRECPKRILISFGGGDDRGAIDLSLNALRHCNGVEASVFTGSLNPRIDKIRDLVESISEMRVSLHVDSKDMAFQMNRADFAIISGGTTLFEAAFLGVPALVVQIANNQEGNISAWAALGAARNLGSLENLNVTSIRDQVNSISCAHTLSAMSRAGQRNIDGKGAERIVAEILRNVQT